MALEIERRFLVRSEQWRALAGGPQSLRQGYLARSEQGITVRLRIQEEQGAWLTLKAPAEGYARHEFEYSVPLEDAEALWRLAPHRLSKTRYTLNLDGGDWVVDCFAGENAPLVLAEVELPVLDVALEIPSWCGREITGDNRWSNAALASQPLAQWPDTLKRSFDLL
ncbi:MAG: CYTH domain-containing protein [Synechococcus sp.]|nr:CYTH domain-containing protein [Synechococcus sp.]